MSTSTSTSWQLPLVLHASQQLREIPQTARPLMNNFLNDVLEQGRRAAVDVLHGESITDAAPFSPEVPDELREWLPDLFDRFPIVLPWQQPQPVDPALHTVWILDNTAFRTPSPGDTRPDLASIIDTSISQAALVDTSGNATQTPHSSSGWEVEFVAYYFIKNSGKHASAVLASLASLLSVPDDDESTLKLIATRLEPFVNTVLPNRTLRISLADKEHQTLGPSSHAGSSTALHELHFTPSPLTPFHSSPTHLPPPFGIPSTTHLASERGWGLISAIDDTLKPTHTTSSPLSILHSTFLTPTPTPIPGMPDLLSTLTTHLSPLATFYLSASPYTLYPFLRTFREAHYPPGPILLRDATWQNLGGLIASLTTSTFAYKLDRLTRLHAQFPHRTFVCIGDSALADPEVYAHAALRFPGWIRGIFIRKVPLGEGEDQADEERRNSNERFANAFADLPLNVRWCVFDEPEEVRERVGELLGEREGEGQAQAE